jgi:hypothetical protein
VNDTPRYSDRPKHSAALQGRLVFTRATNGEQAPRLLRTMANVVIAQMLPGGAVKGGAAMNLRLGPDRSRFSSDLDVSRPRSFFEDDFIAKLQENLAAGWSGFTGVVIKGRKRVPGEVPEQYVMQPYAVQIIYAGKIISRVPLEISMDEIDSTEVAIETTDIGLDAPQPCSVLSVEHQIAQKIHACTTLARNGTSERAHDLVDLQLLYEDEESNPIDLGAIGRRLFALRKKGEWPPTVSELPGWPPLYVAAAEGLEVRDLAQAIVWVNELISTCAADIT